MRGQRIPGKRASVTGRTERGQQQQSRRTKGETKQRAYNINIAVVRTTTYRNVGTKSLNVEIAEKRGI